MTNKLSALLAGSFALVLALQGVAAAATFDEVGDAGQLLPGQDASGVSDLTAISGSIATADDADLYAVNLVAGFSYTFTVASSGGLTGLLDSQLFLFAADGSGLVANDDTSVLEPLSTLTYLASASGTYYLGISAFGYSPEDAGGNLIFPGDPFDTTGVRTAAPGAGVLAGWVASDFADPGDYTITLAAEAIPEPSSALGVLLLGGLGFSATRRFRR